MADKHVVVDGSNIATEGRSLPSLKQLDEAVQAFVAEHPHDHVTVVVDATFGHRIDPSERDTFEEAVDAGELISPPAGAIGRGDAFVLQIADKAAATVLSNDSFQEFHGQYDWLFDEGRLIGGKPVAGVGWIFMLRTPVRGPASRRSVRAAGKRSERPTASAKHAAKAGPPTKATKSTKRTRGGRKAAPPADRPPRPPDARRAAPRPDPATEDTGAASKPRTEDAGAASKAGQAGERSRRRNRGGTGGGDRGGARGTGGGARGGQPVNEPLAFITFIADHPLGSTVDGTVEQFSSHGAFVLVGEARCYVSLKAMGDPPPRSAREVLSMGETRPFVVQALDAPRRGIDLALPGFERVQAAAPDAAPSAPPSRARGTRARGSVTKSTADGVAEGIISPSKTPENTAAATVAAPATAKASKAATRKAVATTQANTDVAAEEVPTVVKKTTARKAAKKKSTARKSPAKKKSTARKSTARKSTARKSTAKKKSTARKSTAKKKSTARKGTAKRKSPAKRSTAKKKSPAKRSTAKKKSTARKSTARKSTKRATKR